MEDLRATTVIEDPVQRRDLILLERAREGDLNAFNDLVVVLPGHALRAGRPDGSGPRLGVRRGPGGVLQRLPEHGRLPRRQRQVVAEPDRDQRGDGRPASQEAAASRSLSGARGRHLAAAGRRVGRPGDHVADLGAPSRHQRGPRPDHDTTSARRSCCTTSRATTTPRSPRSPAVSVGTVKSRIHRGRLALRGLLADRMDLFRG